MGTMLMVIGYRDYGEWEQDPVNGYRVYMVNMGSEFMEYG